jgi:catechol 2,3-dioxygenase-like lactoylglutathione lyase family enzyme
MAAKKKAKAKKAAPKKRATKSAVAKRPSSRKATASRRVPARKSPETLRARRVSVGLTVSDLQRSIAWYRDVAGFWVGELWKRDGEVRGAELLAGSARLFIGQDDWAKGRDRKKGEGFRVHLATAQSVDEIAAGMKARGGRLDSEPADMPWGERQFSFTDPDGFKFTISSGD